VWITASYDNGVTTDLYIMRSTDEGLTWTGATIVIPNTSRGTCAGGSDGSSFIAGFRLTGPGVGNLIGKYREAGDTAYSTEFTFQTAGAVNIATEDESFHIYMAHDVQGRWVGVWKIDGETQTSLASAIGGTPIRREKISHAKIRSKGDAGCNSVRLLEVRRGVVISDAKNR
jgi:hypothetical protein